MGNDIEEHLRELGVKEESLEVIMEMSGLIKDFLYDFENVPRFNKPSFVCIGAAIALGEVAGVGDYVYSKEGSSIDITEVVASVFLESSNYTVMKLREEDE